MSGGFAWYELLALDVERAQRFYGAVLGWRAHRDSSDGDDGYVIWETDAGPVAGLRELPAVSRSRGAPPNWLGHIAVDQPDAVATTAASLGAQRLGPTRPVAGLGDVALVRDPYGAVFALGRLRVPVTPAIDTAIYWRELATTDAEAALEFYGRLLQWRHTDSHDMGRPNLGLYHLFALRDGPACGAMFNAARVPGIHPHWLYYLTTADVDVACARVRSEGGTVVREPHTNADGSRTAYCEDFDGAAFGLAQPATPTRE